MSVTIEKFVAELGWVVDQTGLSNYKKQMAGLTSGVIKFGGLIAGVFSGAMAHMLITTNRETAAQYRLAKSLGTTADTIEQWGAALAPAGMNFESIGNQMLFLSKSMGKLKTGQGNEVIKKLSSLGLDAKKLQGQSTAEQYKSVISAAVGLKDSAKASALLAGMVDRSGMGAAKMLAYLNSSGESLDSLLGKYEALDINTQKGEESSARFEANWRQITFAFDSAKQELFSLVAEGLTPALEGFLEWVKANRDLIRSRLKYWAKEIAGALKGIAGWIKTLVGGFGTLIGKVGGFNTAVGIAVATLGGLKLWPIVDGLRAMGKVDLTNLKNIGRSAAGGTALSGILFAAYDLFQFFTGKNSLGNQISWDLIGAFERANISILRSLGFTKDQAVMAYRLVAYNISKIPEDMLNGFIVIGQNIKKAVLYPVLKLSELISGNPVLSKIFKSAFGVNAGDLTSGLKKNLSDTVDPRTNRSEQMRLMMGGRSKEALTADISRQNAVNAYKNKSYISDMRKKLGYKPLNTTINVNAQTNASAKDIANEVGKAVKRTLLTADSGGEY